ncbi:hypothetical protein YC2023_082606 [Brassica napus]
MKNYQQLKPTLNHVGELNVYFDVLFWIIVATFFTINKGKRVFCQCVFENVALVVVKMKSGIMKVVNMRKSSNEERRAPAKNEELRRRKTSSDEGRPKQVSSVNIVAAPDSSWPLLKEDTTVASIMLLPLILPILLLLHLREYNSLQLFLLGYTFQATIYHLWPERNNRRHGEKAMPWTQLALLVDKTIRNKLTTLREQGQVKYEGASGCGLQLVKFNIFGDKKSLDLI